MFMKYTVMHIYKCVIVQAIKSKEGHAIMVQNNAYKSWSMVKDHDS